LVYVLIVEYIPLHFQNVIMTIHVHDVVYFISFICTYYRCG